MRQSPRLPVQTAGQPVAISGLARLLLQPRIGIERMFVALEFLLIVELAARRNGAILRLEVNGVRSDRF
mgnify:CR=1 FL=1